MIDQIVIRQEIEKDYIDVYNLNKIAFNNETEAKLVEFLRKSNAFIPQLSIVALVSNKVVGHILLSKITIRSSKNVEFPSLALAPMSVLPNYQNKGVGSKLINYAISRAFDLGYKSIIVLGHEHYYPKFGFIPASKWGIKTSYEVPDNLFMAIELTPGGLKGISGLVEYSSAFNEL